LSCLARSRRAFGEFLDGGAEDGGKLCAVVTARRLVPPGASGRIHAEQPVQLCVNIQEGVVVVVGAYQQDPCPDRALEGDDRS
jgi:hypothetical protein